MKGQYYLNDYMLENEIKYECGMINYNNSHAGSGKSTHIFANDGLIFNTKKFIKNNSIGVANTFNPINIYGNYGYNLNKIIYVTDNTMNKDSVLNNYKDITKILDNTFFKDAKEDDFDCNIEKWVKSKGRVAIVTYAQFTKIMSKSYLRNFIYDYINLVVMDEFHNLYDYANKFDDKENDSETNYSNIIDNLYPLAKNCLLVCLSATPYYIDNGIEKLNDNIRMIYNKVLNSKDLEQIRQYEESVIEKTLYPINFIKKLCFTKTKHKVLIYVDKIETAKRYKDLLTKYGYNAEYICTEKKMNDNQIKIKKYIINNNKLPKELDILIINKAYDTGWDCKDEDVQIVIVDCYNPTTVIQARNRVRHDLKLFVFKCKNAIEWTEREYDVDETGYCSRWYDITNYYDTLRTWITVKDKKLMQPYDFEPFKFEVDEKYIGYKLTKELKNEFVNEFVKVYGRSSLDKTSFNEFKEDLEFNDYLVKTFKGKNNGTYIFRRGKEIRKDSYIEIKKEVEKVNNEELYNYLDSIIGKRLYKDDQKQLAINADVRRNGKLLKGYEAINVGLKADNIPFLISIVETDWERKLENGNKNPMYGKVYWVVTESEK